MLWTFALMCIILALTPGPDNIFVATQSMAYGSRTGWMVTLGLLTGCLWHTSLLAKLYGSNRSMAGSLYCSQSIGWWLSFVYGIYYLAQSRGHGAKRFKSTQKAMVVC